MPLKATKHEPPTAAAIVPRGTLRQLKPEDIKPSSNNPRALFDPGPLLELKESIRQHGVLVPITVYPLKGQAKFGILDGERRHRCCVELESEGLAIRIPANVVEPPDKIAGLLYMFSIHNFREQWELMPTALSLKVVMEALDETDNKALSKLTGLSETQIERCKILLTFPERFQKLSMELDPKSRIPANFWIEARPFLELCGTALPDLFEELGQDGILDRLVLKYRAKKIKSVIHFRRIMEAFDLATEGPEKEAVLHEVRRYVNEIDLETRAAFDRFVVDNRRIQSAVKTCEEFIERLQRSKLEHALERDQLTAALERVERYVRALIERLAGSDPPAATERANADET